MTSRPPRETTITLILALSFGVVMLDRMVQLFLGPDLVAEFGLTPGEVGLLASAMAVCWGASSFVFGMVSDRIGRRRVLIPAMIAFSLLSWLSGMVTGFAQLLVVRALLGVAEGPCWSVIMALAEESSSPGRRGRNVGIVNSAGPLVGSAIAPVFATQIAAAFGWREAFFFAGVPGLILAALIYFYVPEPDSARRGSGHKPLVTADLAAIVRYPALWGCFIGAFALATWIFSIAVFAPLYMTGVVGVAPTTVGFLLGASGLGGFILAIFWPALSDRLGRKPVMIVLAICAALQPVVLLSTDLYSVPWLIAVLLMVTTTGPAIAALVMILIPSEIVPKSLSATAIGFAAIGAEVLGATLAPLLGGQAAGHFGLAAPMFIASAAAIVIFVVGLLMPETGPGRAGSRPLTERLGT